MVSDILSNLLGQMVELISSKEKVIEEILQLSSEQSGMLAPGRAEELLSLVERKQACIDVINKNDFQVLQLENRFLSMAGLSSWEEGKESFFCEWENIKNLRNKNVSLLQETRRIDEQNRSKIDEVYLKLKSDMESLRINKGSVKAYQRHSTQNQGYFIDEKN